MWRYQGIFSYVKLLVCTEAKVKGAIKGELKALSKTFLLKFLMCMHQLLPLSFYCHHRFYCWKLHNHQHYHIYSS